MFFQLRYKHTKACFVTVSTVTKLSEMTSFYYKQVIRLLIRMSKDAHLRAKIIWWPLIRKKNICIRI